MDSAYSTSRCIDLILVFLCVIIYLNDMLHVLFIWNDEIVAYLALHGVTPDEFEEVVLDSEEIGQSRASGRPIVFGETSTGKFLACVFEFIDRGTVVPVTAYEID